MLSGHGWGGKRRYPLIPLRGEDFDYVGEGENGVGAGAGAAADDVPAAIGRGGIEPVARGRQTGQGRPAVRGGIKGPVLGEPCPLACVVRGCGNHWFLEQGKPGQI